MKDRFARPSKSIVAIALCLAAGACDRGAPQAAAPPPAVNVARPVVQEIVEWDEYTGRLAATESVELRSRVTGYLDSIHFRDGQIVKQGDLLMVIDPRPFKAEYDAAVGDVGAAGGRRELARLEFERLSNVADSSVVSRKEFDEAASKFEEAKANVLAAEARAARARLNLDFTQVTAPMSGRVGRHEVSVGNLVEGGTTGATVMTNIVSLDPIYCNFDVSEQAYLKYTRLDKAGLRKSSRDAPNPVEVSLLDENDFSHPGQMNFVDNQIDPMTGTLRGRAVIPNGGLGLLPGTFVKLRLPGSGRYRAIMIPDRAVIAEQSDRFVYVVGADNKVAQRNVTLGRLHEGLRLVDKGLDGNETIIVDGVQRVRVGATVTPEMTTIPPPPATSPPPTRAAAAPPTGMPSLLMPPAMATTAPTTSPTTNGATTAAGVRP